MEEEKRDFFGNFTSASRLPTKPQGTYDKGLIQVADMDEIRRRIMGLRVSYSQKEALVQPAVNFYVSCREGERSTEPVGMLISLYLLDKSPEASEKYLSELGKFDPASHDGQLVVKHLAECDEAQLLALAFNDDCKDMYGAVMERKANNKSKPTPPPALGR